MTTTTSQDEGRIIEPDIERGVAVADNDSFYVSKVKKEDSAEDLTVQEKEENNSLDNDDESGGVVSTPTNGQEGDGSGSTTRPTSAQPRRSCCDHPRIKELYTSADWWSLWIGLATFALAFIAVFTAPYEQGSDRAKYVIPEPMPWKTNPLEAWDVYNIYGTIVLLVIFGVMYLISCKFMGKLNVGKDSNNSENTAASVHVVFKYIIGFCTMSILATLSFWIGANEWCAKNGLGYAVFSIIFGMIVTNTPGLGPLVDETLSFAAKDGEFFIKCSLALLAVQLNVLLEVGIPGLAVAWIGSPLAIIFGYIIGTRLLKYEESLALLTCVGASWCGASAISAVAPIVGAKSEDVALAISVVSFFTLGFTFLQPYFAMGVGMSDAVAGAWIGASVDQTGNVLVSAAIISEEATEVAGIIKMVLNSGLGVMASIIACWWGSRKTDDGDDSKKPFSLVMLWDKFPKFTIGFLITSTILTAAMVRLEGTAQGDALPRAISTLNRWWFAIAFVGIGLTTNIRKLWKAAIQSGIIQMYFIANSIDVALALGLAYIFF